MESYLMKLNLRKPRSIRGLISTIALWSMFSLATTVNAQEASSCTEIVKQISSDIINTPSRGGSVTDQPLVWKNLSWIQGRLGPTQPKIIMEDLYQWDDYTLIVREGRTVAGLGTLPAKEGMDIEALPSLTQVMSILGPDKKHTTAKMSEYNWTCPDSGARLKVLADEGGSVIDVLGKNCASNDPACVEFSVNLGNSEMMRKEDVKMVQTMEVAHEAESDKLLKDYNAFFLGGLNSKNEMNNDMIVRLKSYYQALRNCTPGIFKYAVPTETGNELIFMTSTIQPSETEVCLVDSSYTQVGTGKVTNRCRFLPDSLAIFSDQAAEAIGNNNPHLADQFPLEIEKVLKTQCQTTIE